MLRLKDVNSGYGKIEILHGVSLDVEDGKITCIIGPNGSGKSTILKTIVKAADYKSGSIVFNEENLTNASTVEILKKGILYVCQGRVVFRYLTVKENLEIGAYLIKDKGLVERRLSEVYKQLPFLESKSDVRAGYLSGGEQTLLCIGRALMLKPKIIMLDEPSLGLAPIALNQVYEKIIYLNKGGMTVLLVEQNVRKGLSISDYAYVLDMGVNKFHGKPAELLADDKLVRLYLGMEPSLKKT